MGLGRVGGRGGKHNELERGEEEGRELKEKEKGREKREGRKRGKR